MSFAPWVTCDTHSSFLSPHPLIQHQLLHTGRPTSKEWTRTILDYLDSYQFWRFHFNRIHFSPINSYKHLIQQWTILIPMLMHTQNGYCNMMVWLELVYVILVRDFKHQDSNCILAAVLVLQGKIASYWSPTLILAAL